MYQPYPGGDQSPQQYGQPGGPALATPPPVTRAAQLMYVGAAASLIGVGLWIWMAQMNKAGKNWARITSTVFFAIEGSAR
jgi:hypothetical protein